MSPDAYERHKADVRRRKNEMAAAGRDIAPIPEPANKRRCGRCRRNFKLFCQTYAPDTFSLGWSPAHLKVIKRVERAVLHGGLFAMAMPRGSGKSTLADWAVIWAAAYGHHEFTVLIGSDQSSAEESLDSIKQAVEVPAADLEDISDKAAASLEDIVNWQQAMVSIPELQFPDVDLRQQQFARLRSASTRSAALNNQDFSKFGQKADSIKKLQDIAGEQLAELRGIRDKMGEGETLSI